MAKGVRKNNLITMTLFHERGSGGGGGGGKRKATCISQGLIDSTRRGHVTSRNGKILIVSINRQQFSLLPC